MKHLPVEFPFSLCVFGVFLCVWCGKGEKKVWDVRNWGLMAKMVPSEVTMLGILKTFTSHDIT